MDKHEIAWGGVYMFLGALLTSEALTLLSVAIGRQDIAGAMAIVCVAFGYMLILWVAAWTVNG